MSAKTIAILGASNNRRKYGNKAVRAYHAQGFTVYPVNPHEDAIEGLPCYTSILDVPGSVEAVSIYLPPDKTLLVLEDVREKNPEMVFLNPGSENDSVLARAEDMGLNVLQACSIIAVGQNPYDLPED